LKSGQAGPVKTATPPLNARRSLIGKTYFQIEERALAITEAIRALLGRIAKLEQAKSRPG